MDVVLSVYDLCAGKVVARGEMGFVFREGNLYLC